MGKTVNKASKKLMKKGLVPSNVPSKNKFKKPESTSVISNYGIQNRKKRKNVSSNQNKKSKKEESKNDQVEESHNGIEDLDIDAFLRGEYISTKRKDNAMEEEGGEEGEITDNDENIDSDENNVDDVDDDDDSMDEEAFEEEIKALEEKDPSFYKYLQKNDHSLLKFARENSEGEDQINDQNSNSDDSESNEGGVFDEDSDVDSNDDDDDDDEMLSETKKGRLELSEEQVMKWEESIRSSNSLIALRKVTSAFRSIIEVDDKRKVSNRGFSLALTSSPAFDRLMNICFTSLPQAVYEILYIKFEEAKYEDQEEEDPDKPLSKSQKKKRRAKLLRQARANAEAETALSFDENNDMKEEKKGLLSSKERELLKKYCGIKLLEHPHWKKVEIVLHRTLKTILFLLNSLKNTSNPSFLHYILKSTKPLISFLHPFRILRKAYIKTLLQIWGEHSSINVKLQSFLRLREILMEVSISKTIKEEILKGLYLTYARNVKFITSYSDPKIILMGNCLVEAYSLDASISYLHSFVYIRQLALHLRSAMLKKTKPDVARVLCWQYLHCLHLWVAVLTSNHGLHHLKDLVYPLVSIILGVNRLCFNARHIPLRFHLISLLQKLASSTTKFIPCAPLILEILEEAGMKTKPKAPLETKKTVSTDEGTRLSTTSIVKLNDMLRLNKLLLEPRNIKDAVFEHALTLLEDEAEIYRYCVSFPEFMYPIEERMRKFSKMVSNTKWRAIMRGYFERISKYSQEVVVERQKSSNKSKSLMAWANELESCLPFKNGKKVDSMRDRYNKIIKSRMIQSKNKNEEIEEEEIILDLSNRDSHSSNNKNLDYRGGVRDALLDKNTNKNNSLHKNKFDEDEDDEDDNRDVSRQGENDEDSMISDNDSSQGSENNESDLDTVDEKEDNDENIDEEMNEEDLVQDMNWSSDDEN